jgi:hypothetical protein
MKEMTAVEWLIDNLHYLHSTKWDDILEQAKEMEKEQIMDAYHEGTTEFYSAVEYYIETYGGNQ